MDTSTEQLVRDYLNRLAVAARRSLGPGEVMAFIGRMRGAIERQIGPQGAATPAEVATMLAALGRPEGLVQLEVARLKAARSDRGLAAGGRSEGPAGPVGTGEAAGAPAAGAAGAAGAGAGAAKADDGRLAFVAEPVSGPRAVALAKFTKDEPPAPPPPRWWTELPPMRPRTDTPPASPARPSRMGRFRRRGQAPEPAGRTAAAGRSGVAGAGLGVAAELPGTARSEEPGGAGGSADPDNYSHTPEPAAPDAPVTQEAPRGRHVTSRMLRGFAASPPPGGDPHEPAPDDDSRQEAGHGPDDPADYAVGQGGPAEPAAPGSGPARQSSSGWWWSRVSSGPQDPASAAASPGTGQPGTGQPGTGQPGTGQPGTGQPGTGQPGAGQPGATRHGG